MRDRRGSSRQHFVQERERERERKSDIVSPDDQLQVFTTWPPIYSGKWPIYNGVGTQEEARNKRGNNRTRTRREKRNLSPFGKGQRIIEGKSHHRTNDLSLSMLFSELIRQRGAAVSKLLRQELVEGHVTGTGSGHLLTSCLFQRSGARRTMQSINEYVNQAQA